MLEHCFKKILPSEHLSSDKELRTKDSGKQFLIPSTLIIHGFPICKFAYSLKFICNPKINICNVSAVICRHSREVKYLSSPTSILPTEVK